MQDDPEAGQRREREPRERDEPMQDVAEQRQVAEREEAEQRQDVHHLKLLGMKVVRDLLTMYGTM